MGNGRTNPPPKGLILPSTLLPNTEGPDAGFFKPEIGPEGNGLGPQPGPSSKSWKRAAAQVVRNGRGGVNPPFSIAHTQLLHGGFAAHKGGGLQPALLPPPVAPSWEFWAAAAEAED